MKICTEDIQAEVSLVERSDVPRPHPPGLPATAEAYWRSLYERERARAEAAEARCEGLRLKEVASRARAGSLKWHLDNSRRKLAARVKKLKEVRRAAKQDVLALEAEVARQEKLLRKADVEPGERSPLESLRKEIERWKEAHARLKNRLAWEKRETLRRTLKSSEPVKSPTETAVPSRATQRAPAQSNVSPTSVAPPPSSKSRAWVLVRSSASARPMWDDWIFVTEPPIRRLDGVV